MNDIFDGDGKSGNSLFYWGICFFSLRFIFRLFIFNIIYLYKVFF